MELPEQSPPPALEPPSPQTSRKLAVFNGAIASVGLFFVLGILIPTVLALMSSGGSPWSGVVLGAVVVGLVEVILLSLVTLVPLSVWLILISLWLWRGDVRGRRHLLWLTWFVIGTTLLFGAYAWFVAREPGMYGLGILPALYASLNLVGLQPTRRSLVVIGVLIGTVFLSYGVSVSQLFAFANPGRIQCGIEHGVTLLTATGHVVCIGHESSPATLEHVIMAWKFDTGEQLVRKPFPKFDRYDLGQFGNILAAVVESNSGSGNYSDLLVCDLPSGEEQVRVPKVVKSGNCPALNLSPGGDFVAVAWGPGMIDIFALPTAQIVRSLQAQSSSPREVRHLAFDPQGEFLAVATASEIAVWSVTGTEESPRWKIAASEVGNMIVAPKGPRLIVFTDAELYAVDWATGQVVARHPQPRSDRFSICARGFSSDGSQFGIVQTDGVVILWDTSTGKSRTYSIGGKVGHSSAAMNLDSMKMVAGPPTPGTVWLARWDIARAEELSSYASEPLRHGELSK